MRGAALTDEQLSRQALSGDREAFTELFGRYEAGLYNVVYRVTGSREDAADITQEAFLRVFARLDDLAGREVNLGAYLHRTARNLVYDHGARRARERPTATIERDAGADPALGADSPLSALSSAQGADVRAANARLPERHRLVLALRELEGMSYAEIGRVLDITTGAVAQLLARARLALRRELRLEQVDAERMDPACRARLGWIGALMDGELPADRAHALSQHISLCPTCTASRAAFEDAQVRYRAWLPLPVIGLGLGASTARAADARVSTRATRPPTPPPDLPDALEAAVPPVQGGRIALLVGAFTLVAILVAMSVLVGMRSGSDDSPPPTVTEIAGVPAVVAAPPGVTTRTAGATTSTTTAGTTTATDGSSAPPSAGPVGSGGGRGATTATTGPSGVGSVAPVRTPTRGGTPTTTAPGASPPAGVATAAPPTTGAGAGEPPASTATEPETTVPPVTATEPTTTEAPPTTDAPTTPTDTTPAF